MDIANQTEKNEQTRLKSYYIFCFAESTHMDH
jgi:hypothetical protein